MYYTRCKNYFYVCFIFRTHGVTGTILVNGHKRDVSQFRKSSCYIRQDSALMYYLTTEETLMIAADLKLGTDVSKTRKKSLVIYFFIKLFSELLHF